MEGGSKHRCEETTLHANLPNAMFSTEQTGRSLNMGSIRKKRHCSKGRIPMNRVGEWYAVQRQDRNTAGKPHCITHGSELAVKPQEALNVMRIIEAAKRSNEIRKTVTLSVQ